MCTCLFSVLFFHVRQTVNVHNFYQLQLEVNRQTALKFCCPFRIQSIDITLQQTQINLKRHHSTDSIRMNESSQYYRSRRIITASVSIQTLS